MTTLDIKKTKEKQRIFFKMRNKPYSGVINPYVLPGLMQNYKLSLPPILGSGQLNSIFKIVVNEFELTDLDVLKQNKNRTAVLARQMFCKLARTYTAASLKEIGDFLGGRDHTTIIHSVQTIDDRISTNRGVSDLYKKIELKIV